MIETQKGLLDESSLHVVNGVIESQVSFRHFREWRLPDTGQVVRRDEGGGFEKVNPFYAAPSGGMITTSKGDMPAALLCRRIGTVDDEREFTCWVEYREPGSDEIIHRSVAVRLKKHPSSQTLAAKL